MRYPEFLKNNGRIGFIAPSFGVVIEPYLTRFVNTKKKLEDAGYTIVTGPNVYADCGFGKSNTPKACAEEINDFFTSDKCDIIISAGGGETMCEDLEFVDFEAIANADPKWYMGYSDNTNLTLTLPTLCDTAAIYGPCACSFGMEPWHASLQDAMDVLCGNKLSIHNYNKWQMEEKEDVQPCDPYNATEDFCMRIVNGNGEGETEFSGRLLGGCLDVASVLCGTKYDKVKEFEERYKDDGIIWFLESCDLQPMNVRRALWQLDQAGWFMTAKGFMIGRPYMYGAESMGMSHDEAAMSVLGKYDVPILFDVDIGHLPPMMPLISGAVADIKAKAGSLSVDMRL